MINIVLYLCLGYPQFSYLYSFCKVLLILYAMFSKCVPSGYLVKCTLSFASTSLHSLSFTRYPGDVVFWIGVANRD